jgi:hypothetical protein
MNYTKEAQDWDSYLNELEEKEVTCNIENPEQCDSCGS